MFTSKKEYDELKKKVEAQEQFMQEMMYHVGELAREINELKRPKEPNYFS